MLVKKRPVSGPLSSTGRRKWSSKRGKEKEREKREGGKDDEGAASFVKRCQRGTWCTITPAMRAHGVHRSQYQGLKNAGCPTTSWRMGTSVSAPPKSRLETKTPPCVECVSLFRPLSSSAWSRDAKVSRHHRSSGDHISCVLRRERCYEDRLRSRRIILKTQRRINLSGLKSDVIKSLRTTVTIFKINVIHPKKNCVIKVGEFYV